MKNIILIRHKLLDLNNNKNLKNKEKCEFSGEIKFGNEVKQNKGI